MTTPSPRSTASPGCSCCSTPSDQRRSADCPSTTSTATATTSRSASAPNPSSSQNHSPTSFDNSSATGTGHASIGHDTSTRWLFPGGRPGQPISSYRLTERLRQIGLRPGQARSTALFQLASELPAAILARLLGIHISVAVKWQRHSAGDWTNYAADVSRRDHPTAALPAAPGQA